MQQPNFPYYVADKGGFPLNLEPKVRDAVSAAMFKIYTLGVNSSGQSEGYLDSLCTILIGEVCSKISLSYLEREHLESCAEQFAEYAYQSGLDYRG